MAISEERRTQEAENLARIREIKGSLGSKLVILGHYYQRLAITGLSDHLGDSFGLSALAAASKEAKYIVFCGVAFMAESAEILGAADQKVYHPHFGAGCPMADMASLEEVELAYEQACRATGKKVIPVAYMNSSSEVKAFCGEKGGLICTSSNSQKAFEWAYDRGEVILFIPDEHLGTNTADVLNIPEEARAFVATDGDPSLGAPPGSDTRLVLFRGYCHVHTWFTPDHIRAARREYFGAQVVVHPECPREVVALADANGSTAYMKRYVREAPAGSTLIVGTEFNMVDYLADQFGENKTILPLSRSFCPNMFKINLQNLRDTLESVLKNESTYLVTVDPKVKEKAKVALDNMLELA